MSDSLHRQLVTAHAYGSVKLVRDLQEGHLVGEGAWCCGKCEGSPRLLVSSNRNGQDSAMCPKCKMMLKSKAGSGRVQQFSEQ